MSEAARYLGKSLAGMGVVSHTNHSLGFILIKEVLMLSSSVN